MTDRRGTGWLNGLIEEFENDPDYIAGDMALRLMEQVCQLMEEKGLTRSDLAERMRVNRARVTQMLNAPPNLTLRSIAQLAVALGATPRVSLLPPPHKQKAQREEATTIVS